MREKELRLALVCYGGISLAVYMHGITKEIWHLARASRAFTAGDDCETASETVYRRLLECMGAEADIHLRVLVDIIAGASAGGLNGIFLAQAISRGQTLDPLTGLWLEKADVEELVDPQAKAGSRFSKLWATPIAWAWASRQGGLEDTVEPAARSEVKSKLGTFVRGRWFEPPFAGAGFTELILDALDAMAAGPAGQPLLPDGQPLDLMVTVTDFHGHPERLRLHSPDEVMETEHRLTLAFTDRGHRDAQGERLIADTAELAFAARATASFPGAFPPFRVCELDEVLAGREQPWLGRDAFLSRALPRHHAAGHAETATLIDGSVLANAPFRPAVDALRNRPARREIDRRFVYIDPHPGTRSFRLSHSGEAEAPGFFQTIFGAMSDIPREQPIRDNLETIEGRSRRIERMRTLTDAIRPEVEAAVEEALGKTFFLDSPTAARLLAWRAKAHDRATKGAGYAFASYGHLKLNTVAEELAILLHSLGGPAHHPSLPIYRHAIAAYVEGQGLRDVHALSASGASDAAVLFFRRHDLRFRIRRLRFLARRIEAMEQAGEVPREAAQIMREGLFDALTPYLDRQSDDFYDEPIRAAARIAVEQAGAALDMIAERRGLQMLDDAADERLAAAFNALPKGDARRRMLLAYLGFPFYDIAVLPLLQGEGLDEFDPVKVDRIAPEDARAIRSGGAEATLKGIQFNSFGAFFSRAYRENDYLWGRLHGADRLIDIVASTLPQGRTLRAGAISGLKRDLFRAILTEERDRLKHVPELFEALEREVG
ncbi:patatin-like protein [Sphingomonas sp. CGMCC 1.13654]|uniref:Patatin-like protein n=1 Tax=Sphingomonas chungangi TaxID=2683589 RepID=A0A838LE06_9SPHN|nr:patatin-like protein [Sphingomonas chungangi]MBA2935718.1 patatin-like protein [Sphingomonas chungangi]MVW54408.1 patatin-like protein [Sphingomonas chungangi]